MEIRELKNGDVIHRCQGLYDNRMQCVRASEFELNDGTKVWQLCKAHKNVEVFLNSKKEEKNPENEVKKPNEPNGATTNGANKPTS